MAVSITAPSMPPAMHIVFNLPNVALTNIMASRVLRQLRLGILNDRSLTQSSRLFTDLEFRGQR